RVCRQRRTPERQGGGAYRHGPARRTRRSPGGLRLPHRSAIGGVMIYRIFVVLVFIAIIVGSVLLGGQAPENVATTTVDERAGDLGYSARNTRMIETGPDGRPMYTIEAGFIHEPPASTTVLLSQVRLGFKDTNGNQWQGRADAGEMG